MARHLQFRVFENFSFVVSDHDFLVVMIKDVSRVDRNFAAAPWCIDDELRHRVTGRVPAQTFDNLDPFGHRSSEVSRSMDQIALIDVIWADAAHDELMNQRSHHSQIIIYTFQEHTLVAERNAVVDEAFKSCLDLSCQLTRMVDMNAHPKRMKFLQHPAQFRRDSLRQEDWDTGADPDKLDMFDRAQTTQNSAEFVVGEEQGVSAGK